LHIDFDKVGRNASDSISSLNYSSSSHNSLSNYEPYNYRTACKNLSRTSRVRLRESERVCIQQSWVVDYEEEDEENNIYVFSFSHHKL